MTLLVHGVVQHLKKQRSLIDLVAKHLKLASPDCIKSVVVVRRSIDARKTRGRGSRHLNPRDEEDIRDIRLVLKVQTELKDRALEERVAKLNGGNLAKIVEDITPYKPKQCPPDSPLLMMSTGRPVVVGSGPGGLFAAYTLACSGLKPIIVEMGPKVEKRSKDLMAFWKNGELTTNSNGVFGEGGAGAFSDGKLTTRTTSPYHRFVHETLIKYGAKPNILYESRAHVGTDKLRKIITRFSRDAVTAKGGTFLYNTQMRSLKVVKGKVVGLTVERMPTSSEGEEEEFQAAYKDCCETGSVVSTSFSSSGDRLADGTAATSVTSVGDLTKAAAAVQSLSSFSLRTSNCFIATGHSARSVFDLLHAAGVSLSVKDFAVGLRLQISQKYINRLQFGSEAGNKTLGAAEFTLKCMDPNTQRGVYTFCMCPGGVIVNASYGNEQVAVNGMSYSTRASRYANAAFVVTVSAEDFVGYTASGKMDDEYIQSNKYIHDNSNNHSSSDKVPTLHPLSGMWFQQYWERECYRIGGNSYACPAMRAIDYVAHGLNEIRGNNDNNNNNNNDNTNNNNNNTNNNTNNTNNNNNNNNNNNTKKVSTTSYSSTTQGNGEGSTSRREAARTTTGVETEVGLPDNIFMGSLTQANLHECLPPFANTALVHALQHFARDIPGLLDDQSLLIGIETRTSSPVRIDRDPTTLESVNTQGLHPVGEGAGYAGGIMTSCVDGVRAVEAMLAAQDVSIVRAVADPSHLEDTTQKLSVW